MTFGINVGANHLALHGIIQVHRFALFARDGEGHLAFEGIGGECVCGHEHAAHGENAE